MSDLYEALRWVQLVVYSGLGVLAIRMWFRRRTPANAWIAATFGILGGIVIVARVLPEEPQTEAQEWAGRVIVAVLALFPYCLYRFMLTFRRRIPWVYVIANASVAIVVVWALLLPEIPEPGEPRSRTFLAFLVAFLGMWTALSALVTVRLWRAGSGQPTVARRRMRTIAVGAATLALALLVSGAAPSDEEVSWARIATQLIALLSAPLFLLGFAPPNWVLTLWRRQEEEDLRDAEIGLMRALERKDVVDSLLPAVVGLVGGRGAAILSSDASVLGVHQVEHPELRGLVERARDRRPSEHVQIESDAVWVPMSETGWLVVLTTSYMPFFGEDDARGLLALGVMTDMALNRATLYERELQNVDTMRDFVAIASHDLRTPTAVINGYATMLESKWEDLTDTQKHEMVATVRRHGIHLARLIEDLLTISQIEASVVRPAPETVRLGPFCAAVVRDLGPDGEPVRVMVDEGLHAYVDPEHLRRILTNFIKNAAVYGAPPVLITSHQEGRYVVLRVVDHGPGVPPDFAPRLFGKFARADKKTSKATEGTGLGLSIVRGLARAGGGDAWYLPNQPQGSIFAVRLPAGRPDPAQEDR